MIAEGANFPSKTSWDKVLGHSRLSEKNERQTNQDRSLLNVYKHHGDGTFSNSHNAVPSIFPGKLPAFPEKD